MSITHPSSSARTQTTRRAGHYGEVTEVVVWVVVVCAGGTVMTGGASTTVGYDELYCVEVFFSTVPLLNCVVVEVVVAFAGSATIGAVTTGEATTSGGTVTAGWVVIV
jgi:hypothetical protein